MTRKQYGVEQIIVKLREIELLCNQPTRQPRRQASDAAEYPCFGLME